MGKFGNKRIPKFMSGEPIPESHEGVAIHPEILSLKGHGDDHAMIIIKTHDGQEVELRFDYDGDGMLTAQHGDHEYSIPVEVEIVSDIDESAHVDEISNMVKRSAFLKAWDKSKELDPANDGFKKIKASQQAHAFQTHISPEIKREADSVASMFGAGVSVEIKKGGGGSSDDYQQFVSLEFFEGREIFAKITIYSDGRVDKVGQFPENIQRRLIKGLEDLMISYDMTIRTNKNKIVQFSYGDDSIDTTKAEDQAIPIVTMSTQDIYAHFLIPEENGKVKALSNIFVKNAMARHKKQNKDFMDKTQKYIDSMITAREAIIKHVFKNKGDSSVSAPVAFSYVINNIQGQCNITFSSLVDITPLEALEMIENCFSNLEKIYYAPPTNLFKTLFYYYLSPKDLLIVKRYNKAALTLLLDTLTLQYKRAIVAPGEMVGMIAGQSIGEVSTQMTLNTFHFAGVASKSNVTRGVPRIEEILSLSSEIKNPSLSIYLKPEDERQKRQGPRNHVYVGAYAPGSSCKVN